MRFSVDPNCEVPKRQAIPFCTCCPDCSPARQELVTSYDCDWHLLGDVTSSRRRLRLDLSILSITIGQEHLSWSTSTFRRLWA